MNVASPLTARTIPRDYRLRLPGPAAIPERVRAATALPMLSHRGPEFRAILEEATTLMRGILGTTQEVFLLGGCGSAGMVAAHRNHHTTPHARIF
jgi:aspartate aminotransferase-like enzyme